MFGGTDTPYVLAKKFKSMMAWGTDILFNAEVAATHGSAVCAKFKVSSICRIAFLYASSCLAVLGVQSRFVALHP
jgi:hypothetical protein